MMTPEQTLLIFERALDESPSPEGWRKFWRDYGLDPDALAGVIAVGVDSNVKGDASAMQSLCVGFLLGRMSCDPVWGMEEEKVDPRKPHAFVGRRDRWCYICNLPDRASIHAIDLQGTGEGGR